MAKIQGSDELIGKPKITILNIDSILNNFFWAEKGAKVLVTTSSKWVYMLNSVEKWLCESENKKKYNKKILNTGGSLFELNSRANRHFITKPRRVICFYLVFYQNPKFEVFRFENGEITLERMRFLWYFYFCDYLC
jgi:hypothetical protein